MCRINDHIIQLNREVNGIQSSRLWLLVDRILEFNPPFMRGTVGVHVEIVDVSIKAHMLLLSVQYPA